MSLVYLQSMYSESCFSECSRNKQQAFLLLRVSKPESVARRVFHRGVLLGPGPLAGLCFPGCCSCRALRWDMHMHMHTQSSPSPRPTSWLPNPHMPWGILVKPSLPLAELCHHPEHLQFFPAFCS